MPVGSGTKLSPDQLRSLHERRWQPVIVQTAVVLSCYAALAWLSLATDSIAARVGCAVGLSFVFLACFGGFHEGAHGLLKNRVLNRLFGLLWATPVFMNFSFYRSYHLEHHRRTGRPGDPEAPTACHSLFQYLRVVFSPWFVVRFVKISALAIIGSYPDYVRRRDRARVTQDAWVVFGWIAAMGVLTYVRPEPMLWIYWLPLAGYLPIVNYTGLSEHHGCEASDDPYRNTRSVRSSALVRMFHWNNNYHTAHHAYPQVPFYNVARLHELIADKITVNARSFTDYHMQLVRKLLS